MKKTRIILGIIMAVLVTAFPVYSQTAKSVADLTIQSDVIRNEATPGGNTRARMADMYKSTFLSSPNIFGVYPNPSWIPSFSATKITDVLPFANGGTGLSTLGTAGQSIRVNGGATGYEFYTPGGGGGTYTASNGLTLTGSNFTLEGNLTKTTTIGGNFALNFGSIGNYINSFTAISSGSSGIFNSAGNGFNADATGNKITFGSDAAGDLFRRGASGYLERIPIGSTNNVLTVSGGLPTWQAPSGGGSVTSTSVVSANGFAGTVATATTTPAITLSTTVTGLLKGNGTAIGAAVSGTDLKTINGFTLIGPGDLTFGGATPAVYYGQLLNQTTFASLTGYTSSTTAATTAGYVAFSGGANTYTQLLEFDYFTDLQYYTKKAVFTGVSSSDFGIGVNSHNISGQASKLCRFNMTTGYLQVYDVVNGTPTLIGQTVATLSASATDQIELTYQRIENKFIFTAKNITNSSKPFITITTDSETYLNQNIPNISKFAVYNFGGSFRLNSLNIFSQEVKYSDIMLIGDSKVVGYIAHYNNRIASQLKRDLNATAVNAGGSETTADVLAKISEIIALAPKKVFLAIGSNDIRNGVSYGTYTSNYSSITSTLTSAGIKVIHLLPFTEFGAVNVAPLVSYIQSTYLAADIIRTDLSLESTAYMNSDLIHPNDLGNQALYETIKASGLLNYVKSDATYKTSANRMYFANESGNMFDDPDLKYFPKEQTGGFSTMQLIPNGGVTGSRLMLGYNSGGASALIDFTRNAGSTTRIIVDDNGTYGGASGKSLSVTHQTEAGKVFGITGEGDVIVGSSGSVYGAKFTQAGAVTLPAFGGSGVRNLTIDNSGNVGASVGSSPTIITDATTARTLTNGDNGQVIRFTSSSPVTVTLANGLTANFMCTLIKSGTGDVSIVSPGSLTPATAVIQVQTSAAVVNQYTTNSWEVLGSLGPTAAIGITALADATDAAFTMTANARKYLPAATLTADRIITIPTGSEGDIMKFFNNEAGFTWTLSGGSIYLSDGVTVISSLLANTNYLIEKVSGKWRILN